MLLLADSVKFERFIKQLFHSVLGQMNVHQEHVKVQIKTAVR